MKICFLVLYNTWCDMLKAFLQEAKWCRDKHMPIFDDYLNNAWVSISGVVIRTHYFLLNQSIPKEALDIKLDIVCYMRESGASEEDAYKHIHSLVNETWKKMNKDRVTYSPFPKHFVETAINVARISQYTYPYGDGHGAPDSTAKNRILPSIIEPIAICIISENLITYKPKDDINLTLMGPNYNLFLNFFLYLCLSP
ncbi:Tricyclene synthase TPS4, chloroplastic, partial [Mucuna pruriens]